MDKFEIRRLKLIELIESKFEGSPSKLADKIGRERSYITRCKYPPTKNGAKRISDTLLTAIYENCDIPFGWMDGKAIEENLDEHFTVSDTFFVSLTDKKEITKGKIEELNAVVSEYLSLSENSQTKIRDYLTYHLTIEGSNVSISEEKGKNNAPSEDQTDEPTPGD